MKVTGRALKTRCKRDENQKPNQLYSTHNATKHNNDENHLKFPTTENTI